MGRHGETGIATSDGLRIAYEVEGAGEPVVLVHGWGASRRTNWREPGWIDALARAHRMVVALDVRGHGDSDKPHEQVAYGYASMARDVLAVMDHLRIARADFVGHSLGAFSGVHLLGHHGQRFGAFVLMGIGDEDEDSIAAVSVIVDALRATSLAEVSNPVGRVYRHFIDSDERNDREALALAALQMWPEGQPRRLLGPATVDALNRVLILNGENDVPYVETDEALAAEIPGARLVRIPDADHIGPVTDPRFLAEAIAYLSGNSSS